MHHLHHRQSYLMNKPADLHEIRDFGSPAVISGRYVGDVPSRKAFLTKVSVSVLFKFAERSIVFDSLTKEGRLFILTIKKHID